MLNKTFIPLLIILPLFGCDKAFHYSAGFVISHAVEDATKSKALGCLSAVTVGAAKEAIDFIPDPFDFFATVAGGCVEGIHP